MSNGIIWTVFTKPWKTQSLDELGEFMAGLGFDGIELPVRPGFQVEPDNLKALPAAVKTLAKHGVKVMSVASNTDEATIAACGEAGVPVLRTMARLNQGENYLAAEERFKREYAALVPALEKAGVVLGVQNHCARFVANGLGLLRVMEEFDPKQVAIVWDAAHEALQGQDLDYALDVVWSKLCMVNLKNAIWKRSNADDAPYATYRTWWVEGRQGLASWPLVAEELKRRGYAGNICLTAEYSDEEAVNRLIAEDIAFAKSLFA